MPIKLVASLLLITLLPACSPSRVEHGPLRLRVLSYNIHHGRGADGVIDLERIAGVINRVKPDLVALQEVDRATRRSNGINQAAKLGELTNMHHYFAQAMPYQGGGYGEAILFSTKSASLRTKTIPLNAKPNQEPRAVAIGEFTASSPDSRMIIFGGTHLCHQSSETRLAQINQINKALFENPRQAYILAGDYNFEPDSPPYQALTKAGWADAAATFDNPKSTYPANNPNRRIDYVFVHPAQAWRVISVQVLDESIASDHRPLLVELEYRQP